MESFYGGKRGKSFTIAKVYSTVADMQTDFAKGTATLSEVGYGEYVLIDTVNKQNRDNGKVYYRNIDSTPVYLGKVSGPQGNCPKLTIVAYDSLSKEAEGSDTATVANGALVPGKKSDGTFNDSINWKWFNKTEEYTDASGKTYVDNVGAEVGLAFPYLVQDFTAESISAYTAPTATRTDDGTHPFYETWKLGIPKGKTGTSISKVETYRDSSTGKYYYKIFGTSYATSEEGTEVLIANGIPYNVIRDIAMDDDGTVIVYLTSAEDITFNKKIKWIDSLSIADDGKFSVKYNNASTSTEIGTITSISKIEYNELDGALSVTYNSSPTPVNVGYVVSITDVNVDDKGQITVSYNHGDSKTLENKVRWVKSVTFKEGATDGTLVVTYNDDSTTELTKAVKSISNVEINTGETEGSGNQKVCISYNDGTSDEIGNPLNYIMEAVVSQPDTSGSTADDYHLLVLYADVNKRGTVSYPSTLFSTVRNDWVDLGSIGVVLSSIPPEIISTDTTKLLENGILINTKTMKYAE